MLALSVMRRIMPRHEIGLLALTLFGCGGSGSPGATKGVALDASATESPDGDVNGLPPGTPVSVPIDASSVPDDDASPVDGNDASAVDGNDASPIEGDGAVATLGCAHWQVSTVADSAATAVISGGALILTRPGGPAPFDSTPFNGAELALSQPGLQGDFDITVAWGDFQPGGGTPFVGPRVQAGVWFQAPPTATGDGSVSQSNPLDHAEGTVGGGTVRASIVHESPTQLTDNPISPTPASLVDASGTFRIQRSGTTCTVTTTLNGQSVAAQSTVPFPEQPLTLFLGIDDMDGMGAGTASIKVTGVTVTGGGGAVHSDDFSCAD
jgi:hypothetical protein